MGVASIIRKSFFAPVPSVGRVEDFPRVDFSSLESLGKGKDMSKKIICPVQLIVLVGNARTYTVG